MRHELNTPKLTAANNWRCTYVCSCGWQSREMYAEASGYEALCHIKEAEKNQ